MVVNFVHCACPQDPVRCQTCKLPQLIIYHDMSLECPQIFEREKILSDAMIFTLLICSNTLLGQKDADLYCRYI
jgi:hypothetical protein